MYRQATGESMNSVPTYTIYAIGWKLIGKIVMVIW